MCVWCVLVVVVVVGGGELCEFPTLDIQFQLQRISVQSQTMERHDMERLHTKDPLYIAVSTQNTFIATYSIEVLDDISRQAILRADQNLYHFVHVIRL